MTIDHGSDLFGIDDIDAMGAEVSGERLTVQRLYRRLTTPPNGNLDAPGEGLDLRAEVNDSLDRAIGLSRLVGLVRAECLRDEEVDTVLVDGNFVASSRTLTLHIRGEGDAGPFDFVLNATAVTVELLRT